MSELSDLMQVPPYMGDEAFRTFLGKHGCPVSLEVVRMRFLGAAVCPGVEADVYLLAEELFDHQMPELYERELVDFLLAFLGLFQEVDKMSRQCQFTLTPTGEVDVLDGFKAVLSRRIDEVVFGFLEGVWQGEDELSLSKAQAAMLTAIEETARTYEVRYLDIVTNDHRVTTRPVTDLRQEILAIDNSIETAITSLLEDFRNNTSAARPFIKRARTLIDELATAEELPSDAIRQCVERQDEIVPIFLRLLRDHADGRSDVDDNESTLFFIIHILGDLGEKRAFEPLMDLLAGEPERVEEVLGGSITETLTQILISVFDGDTERLYGLMNNPDADEFIRHAAFEAWTYYVAVGRIDRTEAEQYLSSAFETLQPQDDNYVWVAWLEAIAHLGFADLRETVRKAFEVGRVSPTIMGFKHFEETLDGALRSDDLVAFLAEDRIAPFTDTIEVLSTWHCFSEEYIRAKAQAKRQPAPPTWPLEPVHTVTNPVRNVGRNDPCPCGSGKKFKKCCLQ